MNNPNDFRHKSLLRVDNDFKKAKEFEETKMLPLQRLVMIRDELYQDEWEALLNEARHMIFHEGHEPEHVLERVFGAPKSYIEEFRSLM